jgi:hypothetical protein
MGYFALHVIYQRKYFVTNKNYKYDNNGCWSKRGHRKAVGKAVA